MKINKKIGILIATLLVLAKLSMAQMEPQQYNLFDFSSHMVVTPELDSLTSQFGQGHPEYGILSRYAPCENCVELVERRTENTRYFIANGSKGTHFWQQTANGPLHYLSPEGYWLSFDGRLSPSGEGIYTSPHQATPTTLDVNGKKASFTLPDGEIVLNNNIHLLYEDSLGTISDFGVASWDNISVGEDGAYVTNAWNHIDIEFLYEKDKIKTTYIIKSSLGYLGGHIMFRDFLEMPDDYVQTFTEGVQGEKGWIGKTVFYPTDVDHQYEFTWDKAIVTDGYTMLEKEDFLTHGTYGQYLYDSVSKTLDLYVANDWLNDSERIYPIRVDPLVTSTTTSTVVYKFRINGEFCGGATYCSNIIDAALPANCTVTNATFTAIYTTVAGTCAFQCWRSDAAFRIWSDSCDNFYPSAVPTPLWLSCIPPTGNSTGNCVGLNINIFSLFSCLTPKCTGSIPIEFRTSYCYCNTNGTCPAGAAVPCTTIALGNASVTVEGHTVEASGATYTIGCWEDQILDPLTVYGVPNYTYDWSTGETTPTIIFNSGGVAGTFTRTCTITDECGVEVTVSFTINTICGLPIEILEYKAVVKGDEVEISWTTASENNNNFFTLEKSADSKNFTLLNIVKGAGNSTSPIRYETMDQNPYFGTNYYRLSQTDFNGNKSPIGVVAVELGGINIYPNPANNILHVEISSDNDCWIEIRDIYGNIVLRELSNGNNLLNISSFKSGVYLVTVHSDFGIVYETKVIKK